MGFEQDPLLEELARQAQKTPHFIDPLSVDCQLPRAAIAITIAADGQWYYRGSAFRRPAMVALLSKDLLLIESYHYLLTPEQLLAITVEDCPFVITAVDRCDKQGDIMLTTHLGDTLKLGEKHPFSLSAPPHSALEIPSINVAHGLQARLSRPCFYRLAEWAQSRPYNGREALQIFSADSWHLLGYL